MQTLKSLAKLWKTGNFLVHNWWLSGPELVTLWSGTGNFLVRNWQLSGGELVDFCCIDGKRQVDEWQRILDFGFWISDW